MDGLAREAGAQGLIARTESHSRIIAAQYQKAKNSTTCAERGRVAIRGIWKQ